MRQDMTSPFCLVQYHPLFLYISHFDDDDQPLSNLIKELFLG